MSELGASDEDLFEENSESPETGAKRVRTGEHTSMAADSSTAGLTGVKLAPESQAIVDALNLSLGQSISGLRADITSVNASVLSLGTKVASVENSVVNVATKVDKQEVRLSKLEAQMAGIRSSPPSNASDASMSTAVPAGSSPPRTNPYSKSSRPQAQAMGPIARRRTLVFGNFERDTPSAEISERLRTITSTAGGVEDIKVPGRYCSYGLVTFIDSNRMWAFLKANKGVKFQHSGEGIATRTLWHAIEKSQEERDFGKRVGQAVSLIVQDFVNNGLKSGEGSLDSTAARALIDANYDRGPIMLLPGNNARPIRIYERDEVNDVLVAASDSSLAAFSTFSDFDVRGHLTEINRAA